MIVYQRVVLCLRNGTLLWIWSSKLFHLFLEVKFVVIASSWNSHHFSPLPLPPAYLQKNCQLVNQGGIVNLTRNLMKQLFISFFVFLCSPLQQTSRVPSHIPRTLLAGIPRIWQKINQTFFLNQHRTTWKVSLHEVTTAVLSYRFVTLVSRLVNTVPHAHFLKSPSWIQAKVNIILILVCTWSDKLSIKSWRE